MTRTTFEIQKIECAAKQFRTEVRRIARLPPAWQSASEQMRNWYRQKAEEFLVAPGDISK